jgi:hypothetical protein
VIAISWYHRVDRTKILVSVDNNQIKAAIKELQDAMDVMAHMEARQTSRARTEQTVRRLQEESAVFLRRTEQKLKPRSPTNSTGRSVMSGDHDSGPKAVVTEHKPDPNRIETCRPQRDRRGTAASYSNSRKIHFSSRMFFPQFTHL